MSKENKQTDFADCFISKQAAMQIAHDLQIPIDGYHQHNQAINNYCAEIGSLPEAIVRCKDCKYKDNGIDEAGIPFLKCLNGRSYGGTRINDYCSWAERRQE